MQERELGWVDHPTPHDASEGARHRRQGLGGAMPRLLLRVPCRLGPLWIGDGSSRNRRRSDPDKGLRAVFRAIRTQLAFSPIRPMSYQQDGRVLLTIGSDRADFVSGRQLVCPKATFSAYFRLTDSPDGPHFTGTLLEVANWGRFLNADTNAWHGTTHRRHC